MFLWNMPIQMCKFTLFCKHDKDVPRILFRQAVLGAVFFTTIETIHAM